MTKHITDKLLLDILSKADLEVQLHEYHHTFEGRIELPINLGGIEYALFFYLSASADMETTGDGYNEPTISEYINTQVEAKDVHIWDDEEGFRLTAIQTKQAIEYIEQTVKDNLA